MQDKGTLSNAAIKVLLSLLTWSISTKSGLIYFSFLPNKFKGLNAFGGYKL